MVALLSSGDRKDGIDIAKKINAVKEPPINVPHKFPFRFFLFANLKNSKHRKPPIIRGMKSSICFILLFHYYFNLTSLCLYKVSLHSSTVDLLVTGKLRIEVDATL